MNSQTVRFCNCIELPAYIVTPPITRDSTRLVVILIVHVPPAATWVVGTPGTSKKHGETLISPWYKVVLRYMHL
eukprot:COSAG02_NODE_1603_length_11734_cov_5.828105_4_plen_74_part_00